MVTLTVDDRQLVTEMMKNLLERIAPEGTHLTTTLPETALALAEEQPFDVAFLDVEMPGMDGVELAKRLQKIHPLINIIFITGYQEYMPDAFGLYASGYLLKPVTEKAVREALAHLRYRPVTQETPEQRRLKVQCFGTFALFCDGVPVNFSRSKSMELFAYLVDRRGAYCTTDMVLGNLWPDEEVTVGMKSMLRTLASDLRSTFLSLGLEHVILKVRDSIAVDTRFLDCDYYRYLDGDPLAIHQYHGEYMIQYEFAEETRAALQRQYWAE